jgi:hypothetical protein
LAPREWVKYGLLPKQDDGSTSRPIQLRRQRHRETKGPCRRLLHPSHDAARIEHTVMTLIKQRIYGIALGYEDLNDHDELRHDPVLATQVFCQFTEKS